jgi:secreted PhoX family phosphatase
MPAVSRRRLLQTSAAVALGFGGLHRLFVSTGHASPSGARIADGFGPLLPDPAGIFDLPAGFAYSIVSRQGDTMSDGFLVPGRSDGMAAFPGPNGRTLVVRNHEINPDDSRSLGPFGAANELLANIDLADFYDASVSGTQPALGGTTTILFDTTTQSVEGQRLSLAGTLRNCAGGPTPWGSWLSCEETLQPATARFAKEHGWVFEVPAIWGDAILAAPNPCKAMGRFNHEAVAVDPASGIVFMTEDQHDGLLYRFRPTTPGRLGDGGTLQALAIRECPSLDTRNWTAASAPQGTSGLMLTGCSVEVGSWFEVEWITLDEVESPNDDLRMRGRAAGAAVFARGEGMWWGNDGVYFACTNGGVAQQGQIWRYVPSPQEGTSAEAGAPGQLQLFVEPNDAGIIDNADNLTVAPWGDLIVCEDGSGSQYLVGITPAGNIYKFGRNAVSSSELAGACFSPDGTTLFVNIQHTGITLAITGPWI